MKIFKCQKCNSKDVFTQTSDNHVGLYCGDCGKWIKWLNKDEQRLVERQIAIMRDSIVQSLVDEIEVKWQWN